MPDGMKVKIENIDWFLSEELKEGTVTFSIRGTEYKAFSQGFEFPVGDFMDVVFSHIAAGPGSWEELFSKNGKRERKLVPTDEWSYEGYGEIVSIEPIQADFGGIVLELGEWSHDERIIGEFIYWKISRLDIFPGHG